eukprot:234982-Pyramimonas_sp.AAC.1
MVAASMTPNTCVRPDGVRNERNASSFRNLGPSSGFVCMSALLTSAWNFAVVMVRSLTFSCA